MKDNSNNPFKEDEEIKLVPGDSQQNELQESFQQPKSVRKDLPQHDISALSQTRVESVSTSAKADSLTPWTARRKSSSGPGWGKRICIILGITVLAALGAVFSAVQGLPNGPMLLMGQLGVLTGNRDLILKSYKDGWHNNPAYVGVMISWANQLASKDKRAALELYNDCVSINPNFASCYLNRGVDYAELNEEASALADYNKAIKLNPQYALAYNNRASLYLERGDLYEALAGQNLAIKYDPNRAVFYFNRGLTYRGLSLYSDAMKDFQKALQLSGHDPITQAQIDAIKNLADPSGGASKQ